jgi:hypothetical protein
LIPSYRCSLLSQIENFPQIQTFKNIYIQSRNAKKGKEKVKRKHQSKGEKKSWQAYSGKEAGHKEVREQLSTETSTSCLKHIP